MSAVVVVWNVAMSHWASSLLIYLCAVPGEDGFDFMTNRHEDSEYFSLRAATEISSMQYGLLVGFAYSTSYVGASFFLSRIQSQRRNTLVIGSIITCASTVMTGLAGTFWELFSARVVLGLGEWLVAISSYALLSDYFASAREVNLVYVLGVYLGSGIASMSVLMARLIGWRSTCHFIALSRSLPALVALCTVPDRSSRKDGNLTERQTSEARLGGDERQPRCLVLPTVLRSKLLIFLVAAIAVRSMGSAALTAYLPQFYALCHPRAIYAFSIVNAVTIAVGGSLSSYFGLRLVEIWVRAGNGRARVYVPALGALLSLPCCVVVLFFNPALSSMLAYVALTLISECWLAPAISVLHQSLPPHARSSTMAIFLASTALASSLITLLYGRLDEHLREKRDAQTVVRFELVLTVFATHSISALFFYSASRCVHSTISDDQPVLFYEEHYSSSQEQHYEERPLVAAFANSSAKATLRREAVERERHLDEGEFY